MASPAQDMAAARACSAQSSTAAAAANLLPGRALVTPPRALPCAGGDDLVREFKNFKSSAAPLRVLLFAGGAWKDLPAEVVGAVREGFAAGRPMVEVPVGGSPSLFDFVRMVQIDGATAEQTPIAWIDAEGRRFFPETPPGGGSNCGAAPLEERWAENVAVSGAGGLDGSTWTGLQVLDAREKPYKILEKIFLAGMGRSAPAARVTAIRRCSNGGASGRSRLRAFQVWLETTKASRGAANVKHGWYGAPAAAVASVVRHGFGQPNNCALRPAARAVGVYIAPPHFPHASAEMADPDVAGERHVVLCRVIMGKAEKVDVGAPWWHPSRDEFDSGVDDLEKPRWYIVWGTRMNTHILPEYVVSFKNSEWASGAPPPPPPRRCARSCCSPGYCLGRREVAQRGAIPFPGLFAELGKSLPPSTLRAVATLFDRFEVIRLEDVSVHHHVADMLAFHSIFFNNGREYHQKCLLKQSEDPRWRRVAGCCQEILPPLMNCQEMKYNIFG